MAIQNPEITIFNPLRKLAPYVAVCSALAVLTACNDADAKQANATPEQSISGAATPGAQTPTTETTRTQPTASPNGSRSPENSATATAKPSSTTPESSTVSVEELEAMDYREFEKVDQKSKVAWRFSILNNQEFIEEGKRWDLQKSSNGAYPNYYKLNNGKYDGMLLDNYYVVEKPSVDNKPQQILDLDNLALRYAVWFLKDSQGLLDQNKVSKFINTQFYDARPGTNTYALYKNVLESTSTYVKPTNLTNVLNTGAKAGKVVQQKLGPNGENVPTMTFPVDLWQHGKKESAVTITYVLTTVGENSMWQRASMEPIEN